MIINGASYLSKGMACLVKPRVLPFLIGPLLINALLYYFGINAIYAQFEQWLALWESRLPEWLGFLFPALRALFFALDAIFVALTFSSVATLIGAPFYGLLAEQVSIIATGQPPQQPLNLTLLLKMIPATVKRELQKLLYYLPRAAVLGLFSLLCLLPFLSPLQPVATILWFVFGARMMSIQYADYAFDNDSKTFGTMRKQLKQNRPLTLGFGSAVQLALLLPVIPIFIIPAAVCGGTLLYCEQLAQQTPAEAQA